MGQTKSLVNLYLPLPCPELPDVMVPHLHHIVRLEYVLAPAAVPGGGVVSLVILTRGVLPVCHGQAASLVKSDEIARNMETIVIHLASIGPVQVEESIPEVEGSHMWTVKLPHKRCKIIMVVRNQELIQVL